MEFESTLERYPVRLANFEGPLDLLLHLIRKHEINIYDIPIVLVTKQYLDLRLDAMKHEIIAMIRHETRTIVFALVAVVVSISSVALFR